MRFILEPFNCSNHTLHVYSHNRSKIQDKSHVEYLSTHIISLKFNMLWIVIHNPNSLARLSLNIILFIQKLPINKIYNQNSQNSMKNQQIIPVIYDRMFATYPKTYTTQKTDTTAKFCDKTRLFNSKIRNA